MSSGPLTRIITSKATVAEQSPGSSVEPTAPTARDAGHSSGTVRLGSSVLSADLPTPWVASADRPRVSPARETATCRGTRGWSA